MDNVNHMTINSLRQKLVSEFCDDARNNKSPNTDLIQFHLISLLDEYMELNNYVYNINECCYENVDSKK